MSEITTLYRYDREYLHNGDGEFEDYAIALSEFKVWKPTPYGHWITLNTFSQKTKFVLSGEGRRFAHTTKEFAWDSFKIRTKKSLMHSKAAVKRAEQFLELIEEKEKNEKS